MADEIESTLLGLWLGAALFFSAVVAPSVFTVLRGFDLANANEIAGTIVTRSLSVINIGGFAIGSLSLAIVLMKRGRKAFAFIVEWISVALLAATTGIGHWVIAARMRALRTAMVTIDLVSPQDPRRVSFNELHHYSVLLLGVAIIAAAVALIMGRRRVSRNRIGGRLA